MSERLFNPEWLKLETASEWEIELLEFAKRRGRAASEQECRWLRMQHDCKQLAMPRQEYAMAAAKDGFNERIERAAADTQVFDFVTEGNDYRVTIEVTAIPDEEPEVAVKMEDQSGTGVPHGHIIFPGMDVSVETDDDGWQTIPYADYAKYIQTVMRLQCSTSSGEPMDLTMQ